MDIGLNLTKMGLRIAFLEIPDKGKVRQLRMDAMKKIAEGRSNKADKDKWIQSIDCFTEAIDYCFELKDMFPSGLEVKYRILNITFGIITLISLLLVIYAIYFK